jgi:hypothetical protein
LAKKPEVRPASAEEVLDRLRQIEEGRVRQDRRQTPQPRNLATERIAVEVPPTRELPSAAAKPAEPGWGRVWLAVALIAGAAFAVPLGLSAAYRHGLFGASHAEKGRRDLVYLKSLVPIHQENWPFVPPPPPGAPPSITPGQVIVKGRISANGIFMHPPPDDAGSASITYHLAKGFESFHAEVSQNDGPPSSESPYTFRVYGDLKILWESRPVSSRADQQTCTVSVRGVDNLRIEVRSSGEPRGAHAVWIEPFLTK